MIMITDDPIFDYHVYSAKQEEELSELPVCEECGLPITDECCYEFDDYVICEDCLNDNHRKFVDDYDD